MTTATTTENSAPKNGAAQAAASTAAPATAATEATGKAKHKKRPTLQFFAESLRSFAAQSRRFDAVCGGALKLGDAAATLEMAAKHVETFGSDWKPAAPLRISSGTRSTYEPVVGDTVTFTKKGMEKYAELFSDGETADLTVKRVDGTEAIVESKKGAKARVSVKTLCQVEEA